MDKRLLLFIPLALLALGCEDEEAFRQEMVVSGFLITNYNEADINLSLTQKTGDYYSNKEKHLSGARVTLSSDGLVYPLQETSSGVYHLSNHKLYPSTVFYLEANKDDYLIKSSTTLPYPVYFLGEVPETMTIYDKVLLEWYPSYGHAAYLLSVLNLEDASKREPIDSSYEEYSRDYRQDVLTFLIDKEQISFTLSVLEFMWYGRHRVSIRAIDRNYYDFMRSCEERSTFPPISHITGGRGIFASYSETIREIYLKKVIE